MTEGKKRYLYARIYWDKKNNKNVIYIGITKNMFFRQMQHDIGTTRTTNRYNKAYELTKIKYKEIPYKLLAEVRQEEINLKQKTLNEKLEIIKSWKKWGNL